MKLTILGCHSATPQINTHTTAQILEVKGHTFLIDCGEGTQVQMRKYKVKFNQIKHIFISHLHGDHYFGLVGLISSFRLLTRETDLHIYAPKGLKDVITMQMKLSDSWTNFKLIFHELNSKTSELIFEDDKVEAYTIPLQHRIYTNGFLFKEKENPRKLDINAALNANIDKAYFNKLKLGFDVINEEGKHIKNSTVTNNPLPSKSYAFCSDTLYNKAIIPIIKGVNLLYHESTFLEKHVDLAKSTKHSTAKQAAKIATLANVKQLVLGHYSTRYNTIEDFKNEAEEVFKNVLLAKAGKTIEVK